MTQIQIQPGHIARHTPRGAGAQGRGAAIIDVAQDLLLRHLSKIGLAEKFASNAKSDALRGEHRREDSTAQPHNHRTRYVRLELDYEDKCNRSLFGYQSHQKACRLKDLG